MAKQASSKRITLGTYSKTGLFSSFDEGSWNFRNGLESAIKGAERCAQYWVDSGYCDKHVKSEELGICVAVFPVGNTRARARVIVKFPFRDFR